MMIVMWPPVFDEPIDAPYRPDYAPEKRRIVAIADGLTAWGHTHLHAVPKNFGQVMQKLAREAGISDARPETFSDAADAVTTTEGAQS